MATQERTVETETLRRAAMWGPASRDDLDAPGQFLLTEAFFGSHNNWSFGDMFMAMIIPLTILAWLNSEKGKSAYGMEG